MVPLGKFNCNIVDRLPNATLLGILAQVAKMVQAVGLTHLIIWVV